MLDGVLVPTDGPGDAVAEPPAGPDLGQLGLADVDVIMLAMVHRLGARLPAGGLYTLCAFYLQPGGLPIGSQTGGSWALSLVMVLQYPGLDQLEQPGRAPGHQRHDLPDAGLLDLAGLAGAALGMRGALKAVRTWK